MPKVKIFVGVEGQVSDLQEEVNAWIAEAKPNIIQMQGNIAPQSVINTTGGAKTIEGQTSHGRSFAPSDILVMFLYEG